MAHDNPLVFPPLVLKPQHLSWSACYRIWTMFPPHTAPSFIQPMPAPHSSAWGVALDIEFPKKFISGSSPPPPQHFCTSSWQLTSWLVISSLFLFIFPVVFESIWNQGTCPVTIWRNKTNRWQQVVTANHSKSAPMLGWWGDRGRGYRKKFRDVRLLHLDGNSGWNLWITLLT